MRRPELNMAQPDNGRTNCYALHIANRIKENVRLMTEQIERERLSKTKLGVLMCFALACALFAASLLTPQSAQVGPEGRLTAGPAMPR